VFQGENLTEEHMYTFLAMNYCPKLFYIM